MRNPRILNSFEKLSDSDIVTKAQAIVGAMTQNANFANPDPPLADVTAALTDYTKALSAAQTGDRPSIAVKNEKREVLTGLLHKLGNYVQFAANGNEAVMVSSGYSVAKEAEPLPPLEKPQNLQVFNGDNNGELNISISKVPGARAYQYQFTPDPLTDDSKWEGQFSTTTKTTISGLHSGNRYWCRVAAIGTNEQMVFSDAISRVVQ